MTESTRITRAGSPPGDSELRIWMGENAFVYWKQVAGLIDRNYPSIFIPEWLFGGKKHGWSVRYKKSKSFCTLVPEKNRLAVLTIFGKEERQKVEAVKDQLSASTQREYDKATTYHDGKWVLLIVDSDVALKDLEILFRIKRKPKSQKALLQ